MSDNAPLIRNALGRGRRWVSVTVTADGWHAERWRPGVEHPVEVEDVGVVGAEDLERMIADLAAAGYSHIPSAS